MNYYLLHITYPILFLSVFGRQLCLPVPALLFLLSAGAMVGAGKLSFFGILTVAVLGCLLADLAWYEAGRRRGHRVLRLLCALAPDPSKCIRNSKKPYIREWKIGDQIDVNPLDCQGIAMSLSMLGQQLQADFEGEMNALLGISTTT